MTDGNDNLRERIPGDLSASVFEGLQHEKNRQHIIGIMKDYTDHVDFMSKVRKYASDEMDSRMFTSLKFWAVSVASAAVTSTIGAAVVWIASTRYHS